MKKIILHGHLREKYPHDILVEASSVAEAVRSLETIEELIPPAGMVGWPVTIQGVDNEVALHAATKLEEIHIYPRTGGGGGKSGLMQILIGVALIGLGLFLGPGANILGGFITAGSLVTSGAMLVLGGLLQLLVPTPDLSQDGSSSKSSRYLGAGVNTVEIGTRIPIAYGNNMMGGHYLSFDVDAVEWAGDDEPIIGSGAATLVGDSVYVEHDKGTVTPCPVHPIFSSPVASPSNIPSAGWIA